ncbi:MAG: asparaginase [Candidatus Dormibacteraeota bacterium]|nr:asparaginase [Candidatus Dormibacteraeota bacterium]
MDGQQTAAGDPAASVAGQTMGQAVILARAFRGPIEEAVIRGHIAVVASDGALVAWAGNPRAVSTLRSSFKPFQATSFVESGTADALGLGDASIAIAGASHHGEPAHLEVVRAILAAASLPESALRCGVHLPSDPAAAAALLARGEQPTEIHNNCSGKHAAMVAVCAHRGWPLETYLDRHHPLQEEIAARLGRNADLDPAIIPYGIDGCGLPTFGLPIEDFARALSHAAATDPAFRRCLSAMAAHPFLVAGTNAFDTLLMEDARASVVVKSGAAGILAALARDGSRAVVVKLESGAPLGLAQIAARAFELAGLLNRPMPPRLQAYLDEPTRNWVGSAVGEIRADFELRS